MSSNIIKTEEVHNLIIIKTKQKKFKNIQTRKKSYFLLFYTFIYHN